VAFPSVIRRWLKSLLKKAFAPPVSVTARTWIGKLGMFIENALEKKHRKQTSLSKAKYWAVGKFSGIYGTVFTTAVSPSCAKSIQSAPLHCTIVHLPMPRFSKRSFLFIFSDVTSVCISHSPHLKWKKLSI